jgi:hypothetical protein
VREQCRWLHKTADVLNCKSLDLIHRSMSDFAIHLKESIIDSASPNSAPRDEWQIVISRASARNLKSQPLQLNKLPKSV